MSVLSTQNLRCSFFIGAQMIIYHDDFSEIRFSKILESKCTFDFGFAFYATKNFKYS